MTVGCESCVCNRNVVHENLVRRDRLPTFTRQLHVRETFSRTPGRGWSPVRVGATNSDTRVSHGQVRGGRPPFSPVRQYAAVVKRRGHDAVPTSNRNAETQLAAAYSYRRFRRDDGIIK